MTRRKSFLNPVEIYFHNGCVFVRRHFWHFAYRVGKKSRRVLRINFSLDRGYIRRKSIVFVHKRIPVNCAEYFRPHSRRSMKIRRGRYQARLRDLYKINNEINEYRADSNWPDETFEINISGRRFQAKEELIKNEKIEYI